ncbi:MAG: ABC transporter substrate-binding protein [Actinobacteria bacterium]|nr:ABC transporter substrate-binding protein [Actinomycetota bacterium]
MREKTIRSVGAGIVLVLLAVGAVTQTRPVAETPVDIDTPTVAPSITGTTPVSEPFVYRVGVLSGLTTDNFWAFYGRSPSVWDAYILGPTKPALFRLDTSTGTMEPELAVAETAPLWDEEGWRVRVTLDERMHWSDGAPITAEDFVFTFDTVRRLELGGSWALTYPETVESVHADGAHSLRIEFSSRPNLGLWPNLVGTAPVMARHVWEDLVDDDIYDLEGVADVAGGPMTLADVTEDLVVSIANPGYALATTPDRVEYHVFEDGESAAQALAGGSIDTILSPEGLTKEQIGMLDGNAQIEIQSNPANAIRYLGFNLSRAPMSDQAFRTALALVLDRAAMTTGGAAPAQVIDTFVGPANAMWYDAEAAEAIAARFEGDLAARLGQAVGLLEGAGYTWVVEPSVADGGVVAGSGLQIGGQAPAILTILTPGESYDPERPAHAAQIAEALGWFGFTVRPVETDFDTVVDLTFTPGDDGALHYDMYILGWTLGNPALPGFYRPLFASDGVQNNTGYDSARFEAELARYERSYDIAEAREALWAMERILAEDLPYLLLYSTTITEAYRSDRVEYGVETSLGGLQGRLGGIGDVRPVAIGAVTLAG